MTYSSRSNVVSIRTRVSGSRAEQPPGRFDAVELRHADVHQDEVGLALDGFVDRLDSVAASADDLDVGLGVEDQAEAVADERLIVGEQDGDHCAPRSAARAWTVQPSLGRRPVRESPPQSATRSRMPTSPWPRCRSRCAAACAVVVDLDFDSRAVVAHGHARPVPSACLSAVRERLLHDRYAERSIACRQRDRRSLRSSARRRALLRAPASTSASRSSSPGCGASASPSSARRRTPSRPRISSTVWRPVASIASSASRPRAGRLRGRARRAPAWTTIIEMLWAITSCSSRAIRPRSTATAACACTLALLLEHMVQLLELRGPRAPRSDDPSDHPGRERPDEDRERVSQLLTSPAATAMTPPTALTEERAHER